MAGSGTAHLRRPDDAILRVEHLVVEFPVGRSGEKVHAVSDVSLDVRPGETLGLVGESGCGKSTTGKAIMQLPRPTSGSVTYEGTDLVELPGPDLRKVRPGLQMIFQDPISSLNPRRRVGDIVAEPLRIWASVQHPPTPSVALSQLLLRVSAYLAFAGAAIVVLLWLVGAVVPYLANSDDFGLVGAWEWIAPTGGTLMVNGIFLGLAAFGISTMVRDRVPRARGATAALAAINLLFLLLALSGRGTTLSTVVWLVGTVLTAGALVVSLLPASRRDYDAMVEVRAGHDEIVRRVLTDVGLDPDTAAAVGR